MKKITFFAKDKDVKRQWYLVDASNKVLGRLATKVASILKGKYKTIFTTHVDCGDYVVVVNASKIRVTGDKLKEKYYLSFSGYPGGLKKTNLENMLKTKPEEVIRMAVRRMLPRKPLYMRALAKLKVYRGQEHPYKSFEFKKVDI